MSIMRHDILLIIQYTLLIGYSLKYVHNGSQRLQVPYDLYVLQMSTYVYNSEKIFCNYHI